MYREAEEKPQHEEGTAFCVCLREREREHLCEILLSQWTVSYYKPWTNYLLTYNHLLLCLIYSVIMKVTQVEERGPVCIILYSFRPNKRDRNLGKGTGKRFARHMQDIVI